MNSPAKPLAASLLALSLAFSPISAFAIDSTDTGDCEPVALASSDTAATQTIYRLYNKNSGEHFYTSSTVERDSLASIGWNYEGEAWIAPTTSNEPVRRLYNDNSGDHHYTKSYNEVISLIHAGWIYEGISWYSADASSGLPLYRAYNPNATVGTHHYTTDEGEFKALVNAGWQDEGIAWYGVK